MPRYPEYRMDPNMSEEDRADIQARQAAASQMHTYTSAKERYSEAKSSAWTFLVIGCAGFLAVTVALTGVFHLPLNHFSLLVLDAVFLLFIGIAFLSFHHAARLTGEVTGETDLNTRIRRWATDNLRPEELMVDLDANTSEEMKYFLISEMVRERLMRAFPEIDDAYAEEWTENYYNENFYNEY